MLCVVCLCVAVVVVFVLCQSCGTRGTHSKAAETEMVPSTKGVELRVWPCFVVLCCAVVLCWCVVLVFCVCLFACVVYYFWLRVVRVRVCLFMIVCLRVFCYSLVFLCWQSCGNRGTQSKAAETEMVPSTKGVELRVCSCFVVLRCCVGLCCCAVFVCLFVLCVIILVCVCVCLIGCL